MNPSSNRRSQGGRCGGEAGISQDEVKVSQDADVAAAVDEADAEVAEVAAAAGETEKKEGISMVQRKRKLLG